MAVVINGTTGIDTVQDGIITDAKLASTLDISGKTVTYGLTNTDMPSGSVIQVVRDINTSEHSTTSSSAVATNFSVSITPSSTSSRVYLSFAAPLRINDAGQTDGAATVYLYKNGSQLAVLNIAFGTQSYGAHRHFAAVYVDSPATTSATTYAIYYDNRNGFANSIIWCDSGAAGTLTAMEIA